MLWLLETINVSFKVETSSQPFNYLVLLLVYVCSKCLLVLLPVDIGTYIFIVHRKYVNESMVL